MAMLACLRVAFTAGDQMSKLPPERISALRHAAGEAAMADAHSTATRSGGTREAMWPANGLGDPSATLRALNHGSVRTRATNTGQFRGGSLLVPAACMLRANATARADHNPLACRAGLVGQHRPSDSIHHSQPFQERRAYATRLHFTPVAGGSGSSEGLALPKPTTLRRTSTRAEHGRRAAGNAPPHLRHKAAAGGRVAERPNRTPVQCHAASCCASTRKSHPARANAPAAYASHASQKTLGAPLQIGASGERTNRCVTRPIARLPCKLEDNGDGEAPQRITISSTRIF